MKYTPKRCFQPLDVAITKEQVQERSKRGCPRMRLDSRVSMASTSIKLVPCPCQDPKPRCRSVAMRFITTKQAGPGSILLADGSDILLGRSANRLANIHTEVPSAASSWPLSPFPVPDAFPCWPKLLILVSTDSVQRIIQFAIGSHGSVNYVEAVIVSMLLMITDKNTAARFDRCEPGYVFAERLF